MRKQKFNKPTKLGNSILILFFLLVYPFVSGAQIYPVTVNMNLTPPYPVFLPDYISQGANKLDAVVTFNDLNETDRDVFFKIRIESSDIAIYSKPDYISNNPYNLVAGTVYNFADADFEECLNYNNLIFNGIDKTKFIADGGRLPSGFYTFSLETYDYISGKRLSNTSQVVVQIRLNAPPLIVSPQKGGVVPISPNQQFLFQWQPVIIFGSGSANETEYAVSLYKMNGNCTDPDHAIANKQAYKIFESDYTSATSFLYTIDYSVLEVGERYAFRIHAKDIDNRDIFENGGYSEESWFYYGYPQGGHIPLISPVNEKAFTLQDLPMFKWGAPDNVLVGQSVHYEFKIVKTDSLSPELAIIQNEPFYSKTTSPTTFNNGGQVLIPTILDRQVRYAWQVKAFTGGQLIAESEVFVCYGPPLLEMFWANNHKIYVTKTTTNDFNHLSGEGKVRISSSGEMANIVFQDIKVEYRGEWYITSGRIVDKPENDIRIALAPVNQTNGVAFLTVDSIGIIKSTYTQKYELRVKAHYEQDFPHAIDSVSTGKLNSASVWLNFDDYKVYGAVNLSADQHYPLLEPMGHEMVLKKESSILIYANKYTYKLEGFVKLPEGIKNASGSSVLCPFKNIDNLKYFSSVETSNYSKILLVGNTGMILDPVETVFDFSETLSPSRFTSNPNWKGVYFKQFNVIYNIQLDGSGQLKMNEQKVYPANIETNQTIKAWTTGEGLQFYLNRSLLDDASYFNTFPSELNEIKIDIQNSFLNEGHIKGTILFPLISESERYGFTLPLTNEGFNVGYLDDDFTDYAFTINPEGGDQQVNIVIRTISFVEKERLEMTIDIAWPAIDISMDAIDGFSMWGSYAIGFYNPNSGRGLVNNVSGTLEQYEITIESVGCGSSEGAYGFGASGVVVVGDDISGDSGPPKINLYSVYPSIYAPFVEEGDFEFDSVSIAQTIDNLNQVIEELNQIAQNIEDLTNAGEVVTGDVNAVIENTDTDPVENQYSEEDFEYEEGEEELENEEFSMERLVQMLEAFSVFLPEEEQIKLQEVTNFLGVLPYEELLKLFNELKDIKSLSKKLAKAFIQNQLENINAKINTAFNRVNQNITSRIDSTVNVVTGFTDGVIDDVFDAIEDRVIQLTQNNQFDVEPIVHSIVLVSKNALKTEINEALVITVNQNIKIPITSFIEHQIRDSITNFIAIEVGGVAYNLIDNGELDLNIDFDGLLLGIGNSIIASISTEKLLNTVTNLGKDYVRNITFEGYIQNVLQEAMNQLLSANTAFSVAANNLLEDYNLLQNITANVEFDFDNIGEKLKNGQIDEIIKFDLTHIKINTKTLELEGFADFKKDDPVWGNSFQLEVVAKLKLSEENQLGAFIGFITGKTTQEPENYSYWYVAAGVTDILVPLTPTPFNMTGIDGCLYRRMSKQGGNYMPDINTNFGINVNMHLNDISTQGKIIRLVVGTEFIFFDEGFSIQINGDINVGNKNSFSLITGTGYLNFTSTTGFLIGQFNVSANTAPLICAQGEMGIEIKGANDWNVYVGKRETPVFFKILCKDNLALESWFDISNTQLDLGLRANFELEGRSPWFHLGARDWSLFASVGFGFEASTIIWWDPFGINDALIEVSAWSELGADWRKDNGETGTWILVSVSLYGMLNFATVPDAFVDGELSGHVTVCNIGVDFDLEMHHDFS
jgi:hypothetical protein